MIITVLYDSVMVITVIGIIHVTHSLPHHYHDFFHCLQCNGKIDNIIIVITSFIIVMAQSSSTSSQSS
jgi:hypothetical protein